MKRLISYGSITFALAMLFAMTASAAGPAPVNLGTAGDFAILTESGISTTGTTAITGDIGVSPLFATAITGFGLVMDPSLQFSTSVPSTLVTGKVYAADYAVPTPANLTTAVSNMESAYTNAAGRPHGVGPNLNIGGGTVSTRTLAPGTYTWTGSSVNITGDITLHGGANDVWIFQVAGTLDMAAGKSIILAGAQASNVFWQVAGAVTLHAGSNFAGTILAATNIAMQSGATLNGRALAQTAVTLISDTVTATASGSVPVPKGGVIYDSTVSPLPGNVPSYAFEANGVSEFGDNVTFAGTARSLQKVTVTLSSWACQTGHWNTGDCVTKKGATFKMPITFNIYAPGTPPSPATPGALIATMTQTFNVPYRPSADNVRCTGGEWFKSPTAGCFNGLATEITFNFDKQNVALPESVVYGITYNTSNYGPFPIGTGTACYITSAGCPYDSLNVGLSPAVVVGTKDFWNTAYQNTVVGANYCDGGTAGTGVFRLDSPTNACWFDSSQSYIPAVQFTASAH